jgi:hypothetical protein
MEKTEASSLAEGSLLKYLWKQTYLKKYNIERFAANYSGYVRLHP